MIGAIIGIIILTALIVLVEYIEWLVDIRNMQQRCRETKSKPCRKDIYKLCKNCPYKIRTYSI